MEERDDYIPEQKGNEKRITPFERFVPGIIPAHEIACQNQEKCHAAVENRKLEQAGEREGRRVDAYNQTPGFGDTTDFAAIKKHYHIDCNPGNIHQIIVKGPDEEAWLLPHGREKFSEK